MDDFPGAGPPSGRSDRSGEDSSGRATGTLSGSCASTSSQRSPKSPSLWELRNDQFGFPVARCDRDLRRPRRRRRSRRGLAPPRHERLLLVRCRRRSACRRSGHRRRTAAGCAGSRWTGRAALEIRVRHGRPVPCRRPSRSHPGRPIGPPSSRRRRHRRRRRRRPCRRRPPRHCPGPRRPRTTRSTPWSRATGSADRAVPRPRGGTRAVHRGHRAAQNAPAAPAPPPPELGSYLGDAVIAQCPNCGEFRVDKKRTGDCYTFDCPSCQMRWTWRPGEDWRSIEVAPRRRHSRRPADI